MPFYVFSCPDCGRERTLLREIKHRNDDALCVECGVTMHRDLCAEKPNAQSRGKLYSKEIHSDSLAISPTQVEEHKRLFPDIKIDSQSRPVFDNFKDHDAYLEKTGFVKMPGKKKRKSRK
ncbi:zinc ribbon domain-containing protein [bacterium]|nr:zinc ribbon domain-containing protein [bacterium]